MEWNDDLIAKAVISGVVLLGIVCFLVAAFWQPKKKQECDHDWEVITRMTTLQVKQDLRAGRYIGLNVEDWWKRMKAAGVEPPNAEHPDALKFWDGLYPIKADTLVHRVCLKCHRMENEIQAYAIKLIQAAEQRMYRQQIAQWLLDERSGARDSSTVRVRVIRTNDLPKKQREYLRQTWVLNEGGYTRYKIRSLRDRILRDQGSYTLADMNHVGVLDEALKKQFDLRDYDVVMINDTQEGT